MGFEKSAEYYDLVYQSRFNYEKECDLLQGRHKTLEALLRSRKSAAMTDKQQCFQILIRRLCNKILPPQVQDKAAQHPPVISRRLSGARRHRAASPHVIVTCACLCGARRKRA